MASEEGQKLYVFWEKAEYPFFLGAPLKRFTDRGLAVPEGYDGMAFKPKLVLPFEPGKALAERLIRLDREYRAALAEFKGSWLVKLPEELK